VPFYRIVGNRVNVCESRTNRLRANATEVVESSIDNEYLRLLAVTIVGYDFVRRLKLSR
jgi:hypothetical protein